MNEFLDRLISWLLQLLTGVLRFTFVRVPRFLFGKEMLKILFVLFLIVCLLIVVFWPFILLVHFSNELNGGTIMWLGCASVLWVCFAFFGLLWAAIHFRRNSTKKHDRSPKTEEEQPKRNSD